MIHNSAIFVSLFLCLAYPSLANNKSLNEIKKDIIQESKAIQKIKRQKSSILSQIKKNKSRIQNTQQYLRKLVSIGIKLDQDIKNGEKKIIYLKKQITLKEEWIKKRIRFLYIHQNKQFNSFFNVNKELDWAKSFTFIKKFVDTDNKIILSIQKQKQNYQKVVEKYNLKKSENKEFKKIKSKEFKKYLNKIKSYQHKIKKLSNNEKNRLNILSELKLFEKKLLEKQRKRLRFKFAKYQTTCSPLKGFKVVSNYGIQWHLKLKTKTKNLGAEIIGKPRQQVLSVAKGEVLYASSIPGYGEGIIIYHGSNFYAIYGNLKNIKVKVGDKIIGCQAIAKLPKTQRSSERTIYFEVRKKKESIDPLTWLKKVI